MQKMETKTEVLSDLDLEIVASGKGTIGIAQATATPWINLIARQAGYSVGEQLGRSIASGS